MSPEQFLKQQPDILVIITDQERYHTHWPAGLRDVMIPSWSQLASRGLTFTRAYTAASQCSPSRACMLTGEYSKINGVPELTNTGMPTQAKLPNIATVLGGAGYDVFWKGKWHLSFPVGFEGGPPSNEVWTAKDAVAMYQNYGLQEWNTPDAGNAAGAYTPAASDDAKARAADLSTAGSGTANNDGRYVEGYKPGSGQTPGFGESALALLQRLADTPRDKRKPFALFISLVNPHDITFFPDAWQDAGYGPADIANLGVKLPPNWGDSLEGKPSIQKQYRDKLDEISPIQGEELNYVNFYARLHNRVDPHIEAVIALLGSKKMLDTTVIIRTADHGELGLSHGLREKAYSAYEEMIHVPLVISNPVLFPKPQTTDTFYSHVDLLPTLASLAHAPPVGVGTSMLPVMLSPRFSVQQNVLFTFDDTFVLESSGMPGSHIRALREGDWTYAVYYNPAGGPFEYELYNLQDDPYQMNNLVNDPSASTVAQWTQLHGQLVRKMAQANALPTDMTFPKTPTTGGA